MGASSANPPGHSAAARRTARRSPLPPAWRRVAPAVVRWTPATTADTSGACTWRRTPRWRRGPGRRQRRGRRRVCQCRLRAGLSGLRCRERADRRRRRRRLRRQSIRRVRRWWRGPGRQGLRGHVVSRRGHPYRRRPRGWWRRPRGWDGRGRVSSGREPERHCWPGQGGNSRWWRGRSRRWRSQGHNRGRRHCASPLGRRGLRTVARRRDSQGLDRIPVLDVAIANQVGGVAGRVIAKLMSLIRIRLSTLQLFNHRR